jgi:hypothetical protein
MSTTSRTDGVRSLPADERRRRFAILCEAIGELTRLEEDARSGNEYDLDALKTAARVVVGYAVTWNEFLESSSELGFEYIPGGEAEYEALLDEARMISDLAGYLRSLGVAPFGETPCTN